ncbi:hypothetical protein E0J81_11020, partial [Neisseria gonorrhoeae]
EEKPLRQYFKDCVNTENSNNDNCKISSFGNYGPILIKSDIFALASQIKNSHINSEILSVGNYIEWLRFAQHLISFLVGKSISILM